MAHSSRVGKSERTQASRGQLTGEIKNLFGERALINGALINSVSPAQSLFVFLYFAFAPSQRFPRWCATPS